MRNKTTGKYEVHKYFKRSGHHYIGIGDTKEEAKADLQRQLNPYMVRVDSNGRKLSPNEKAVGVRIYYQLPMEPTGEEVTSPGYMWFNNKNGTKSWIHNPDRTVAVMAAPHIAKAKREELEKAKSEVQANLP
jgi:hypothetical protein